MAAYLAGHLAAWILIVWGVTSVVTTSRLLRPLRDRFAPETLAYDFVRCPQCIGWWVGLCASVALRLGVARAALEPRLCEAPPVVLGLPLGGILIAAACDAFASSAMCAGCAAVTDALKGVASLMVRR